MSFLACLACSGVCTGASCLISCCGKTAALHQGVRLIYFIFFLVTSVAAWCLSNFGSEVRRRHRRGLLDRKSKRRKINLDFAFPSSNQVSLDSILGRALWKTVCLQLNLWLRGLSFALLSDFDWSSQCSFGSWTIAQWMVGSQIHLVGSLVGWLSLPTSSVSQCLPLRVARWLRCLHYNSALSAGGFRAYME